MTHDSRTAIPLVQAAGLGAVAGMRSQLPLALLALAASRDQFAAGSETPLSFFRSPVVQRVLVAVAVGELIGDKLPITPSRLNPGPLFGRLAIGGLAGTAIAHETTQLPLVGPALGAVGALLGAELGYHARAFLDRATDVPDPVWGAVEDAAAIALGLSVLRSLRATPEP